MPRVSLILPTIPGDPRPDGAVPALRSALETAGHAVDVIVVSGPGADPGRGGPSCDGWRPIRANDPGLASAAMAGLEAADGDVLLVMDPCLGYAAEDLPRLVAPLAGGTADLVVATRWGVGTATGPAGRLVAGVAKPFTGTTDPLSGLVGLTRAAFDASSHTFKAVGSRFSLELLGKIEGRREDIPVRVGPASRKSRPGLNDVRHLKRLADHHYGNASRLLQFCVVGASGAVVDLSCYVPFKYLLNHTELAHHVVPPTQVTFAKAIARASAIAVALVWNFSLNRRLTFSYARRGSLVRQFATYVVSNLLGVMVSMAVSLGLPRKVPFFAAHEIAAAIVGIVAATGISFSMSRWVVFRGLPSSAAQDDPSCATEDLADEPAARPTNDRLALSGSAIAVERTG